MQLGIPVMDWYASIEQKIREVKDCPILRASINAGADIFLTGDKDFLESGLKNPGILTVAEFLAL